MYLGCFHDRKDDRVLGDKMKSSEMTTEVRRGRFALANMYTRQLLCCWLESAKQTILVVRWKIKRRERSV